MKKWKSIIRANAESRFMEQGFHYKEEGAPPETVVFSRLYQGVEQWVAFQKSSHFNERYKLELYVFTKPRKKTLSGSTFLNKPTPYWELDDYSSFDGLIQEMTDVALDYGISWMELVLQPDQKPPLEVWEIFNRNPEERARDFAKKYDFPMADPNVLLQLEANLLQRKEESTEKDWSLLMDCAAYLGEVVRQQLGGEWGIIEEKGSMVLLNVSPRTPVYSPLDVTSRFWDKPTFFKYGLAYSFEYTTRIAQM